MNQNQTRHGLLAVSPVIVLLLVYLVGSVIAGDFYRIPIAVAFLLASVYAIAITRGTTFSERITHFSEGAANPRIMYMIWIFVLAGAFAAVAKSVGAVDATVSLTLSAIPADFLPAGIFLATCLVSMSIGTSVGSIVALTPIVTGLAEQTGCSVEWLVGIVVGGAFFGDNLSFISDTTIAATQTQGCSMRDKFRTNFRLVIPAAIATLILYAIVGSNIHLATHHTTVDWVKVIPYLIVIVSAVAGINVLIVLLAGITAAGIIGVACDAISFIDLFTSMGDGIQSMCELIIITMLAGGLLEIVRLNGGLAFLTNLLTRHIGSRRGAEISITSLTALANICTANNTIAILTTGDIARDISSRYGITPQRTASLLDTVSCVIQGIIPYGAQLLMVSGLAAVSPLAIIPHLYYPMCLAVIVLISIGLQWPKR
ncbi:MAG: Na+/H+ antiporter NhaC family protein [Paludibacteraceae bacterium]